VRARADRVSNHEDAEAPASIDRMKHLLLALGAACSFIMGCGDTVSETGGEGKDDFSGTLTFAGELNTADGSGAYRYTFVNDDDGEALCDVSYAIVGAVSDDSCADCTFAFSMPLSSPNVVVGGETCDGMDLMDGKSILFGHQEPDVLFLEKTGSWYAAKDESESQTNGDDWTFGYSFTFADDGSKSGK